MAPLDESPGQDFGNTLEGPALQPPAGVIPDFDHPPNHNAYAYATLIVGVSVSSILALTRFYSRVFYVKKIHIAYC
jgi:hypothetical protein